mgnify:CR=1 FL=1
MIEKITSPANARIKKIIKLKTNNHFRQQEEIFVIEGFREIYRAILSGIRVQEIYVCNELDTDNSLRQILEIDENINIVEISESVFAHVAYRETSDGLLALAVPQRLPLTDVKLPKNPLILVVEAVEKPGNLGAIMRTCDAAQVDAVIVCDPLTDIYNPNAIRAALGCMFSTQIVVASTFEAIKWLKDNNINTYAAALTQTALPYHRFDYTQPTAFVLGTEATGLSDEWLRKAHQQVIIPMRGIADSLNVSISAAVLVFEAVRQRQA